MRGVAMTTGTLWLFGSKPEVTHCSWQIGRDLCLVALSVGCVELEELQHFLLEYPRL